MRNKGLKCIFEVMFILVIFIIITWLSTIKYIGNMAALIYFLFIVCFISIKIFKGYELSGCIIIPIGLSVFQNLILGFFCPRLSSVSIQILTVTNFTISCIIAIELLFLNYRKINTIEKKVIICMILIILYSVISIVLFSHINVMSSISSLRNIISIFLFFVIGTLSKDRVNIEKLEKTLLIIGFICIMVGFYEKFYCNDLWKKLNITELWTKKGIHTQQTGLPTNFYSSEKINGHRIRRMTSTFADPVNLGAFLFAIFIISWHQKHIKLALISLIAIVLTVSKGALLGILIFFCVYTWTINKKYFLYIILFSLSIGFSFLIYAYKTSANSVFIHIKGMTASFSSLIHKPLGNGLGSIGVLAKQFSNLSANQKITETGLGMLIGQLGIIGLLIYIFYIKEIFVNIFKIEKKNDLIFCFTLLLSIIFNIVFNEVALSPNSCAIYLLLIGLYAGKYTKKNDRMEKK